MLKFKYTNVKDRLTAYNISIIGGSQMDDFTQELFANVISEWSYYPDSDELTVWFEEKELGLVVDYMQKWGDLIDKGERGELSLDK